MALVCTGAYTIAVVCVSSCLKMPSGPFERITITHGNLGCANWLCIVVSILVVSVGVFCVVDGVLEQAQIWVQAGKQN